jgi:hypothetical protein
LRKLAAVADENSGAFPNEMAMASARLQEMMDKHQVTMAELLSHIAEGDAIPKFSFTKEETSLIFGKIKPWHWGLARAIARITGTRHFSTGAYGSSSRGQKNVRGNSICFYGAENTVSVASGLFNEWAVTIDKMATKATSEYCKKQEQYEDVRSEMEFQGVKQYRHLSGLGDEHPNVYRQSYLDGVVASINEALREHEQERTQETSTALMVVKKAVDIAYADYSRYFRSVGKTSSHSYNASAYSAGREVGKSINIGAKRISETKTLKGG